VLRKHFVEVEVREAQVVADQELVAAQEVVKHFQLVRQRFFVGDLVCFLNVINGK